jgi:hypothetical protein
MMSEAGRERVLENGGFDYDMVIDVPIRWGMGYCITPGAVPAAVGSRVAWWAGNGGSMSWVDLDRRMAFGYAPNRWITGPHELDRSVNLLNAVYESLK